MKKTIRIIILVIAIGIMTFSGYKMWDIYREYTIGDQFYHEYANNFIIDIVEAREVEDEEEENHISIDFDALIVENQDVVGWIYSEATPINYPIVQSKDNDYYLRRMLNGSYNIAGSIFMDYRNSSDFTDLNTIIYGHNLKNGTMFGTLKEYRSEEYYEKHPIIYLATSKNNYSIEVIAGYQTDIYSNIYKIPETTEELEVLYEEIIERSTFKTNALFQEGDRLITLSTCTDGPDISRYVLIGKL
ncbi:MAG: class B sortase [Tissierella sp.]|nr:class B sortase [Tissierella sp.]